ncbi:MAG: DUF3291 domain-containing protein [Hyphomicrobiaceae bacterium]
MHLAQLNIAHLKYPIDDPRMADFVGNLDRINALAERSPGFVWRLKDGGGNATQIPLDDDPMVIPNMSVWESAEALEQFVWATVHQQIYNRKAEWFVPQDQATFVMWWIEEGHTPNLVEARDRLEYLRAHGDTDEAFGWSHLPHVKLWQEKRCG